MAGFGDTVAADYLIMDDQQTVTFSGIRDGVTVSDSVPYSTVYELNNQDVASSSGYFDVTDAMIEMPLAQLAYTPGDGDSITDEDGQVWYVKVVKKVYYDSVWQCVCKKAR